MRVSLFVCLGCLPLTLAGGTPPASGLHLPGDFTIAGLFPLHNKDSPSSDRPELGACNVGRVNKHGYHLLQAMRFAVEQINNKTTGDHRDLLPGVTLGYQVSDICSVPASILSTLDLLEQVRAGDVGTSASRDRALAVIGPDSSSKALFPAALLGAHLVPQISYEASNELLSNKILYPSFFRTIPSDKHQVVAMVQLLLHFRWSWVAVLGSDNEYGLQGMKGISQLAALHHICIGYQAVIPALTPDTVPAMRAVVSGLLRPQVTAVVVFSSKSILRGFLPFVVERNVTGKVWLASEDWSAASLVAEVPGVRAIGTVLGVSLQHDAVAGLETFEARSAADAREPSDAGADCLGGVDLPGLARRNFSLDKYDQTSSFSVYKAVHAVAHALHGALGCGSGTCQRTRVRPWELVPWLKKVRFSLNNRSVYFDQNGDPPAGYDIVTWAWQGARWSVRTVGSFGAGVLAVNDSMIEWPGSGTHRPVPLSICSADCPPGHRRQQTGQHKCCFDCLACPTATFLNKTGATWCQPCPPEQWAPPQSERCLNRTVLLLAWDAPLSAPLLVLLGLTLLLTSGAALVFVRHMDTPVCRSAGGRTCLVMLLALTAAASSALCHLGEPGRLACALKQPLFTAGLAACLACITVRALQVVCIFKLASRLPGAYEAWARGGGPEGTVLLLSAAALLISALRLALDPPRPARDLDFYADSAVLECSGTLSPGGGAELALLGLLSALCFALSYAGKDLPANYSEAKVVTFSLMLYMVSWISFFTVYLVLRGPLTMAAHVLAILYSVLGIFAGYFLPKLYIILLRPHMNTTAHFQNCIQMYTMNKK